MLEVLPPTSTMGGPWPSTMKCSRVPSSAVVITAALAWGRHGRRLLDRWQRGPRAGLAGAAQPGSGDRSAGGHPGDLPGVGGAAIPEADRACAGAVYRTAGRPQ